MWQIRNIRNLAYEPGLPPIYSVNLRHPMRILNRAVHDPDLCNASVLQQTTFT
ncbi:uncharacterized protein RAG0_02748 [Rhynchosporium agropyri]|uniref:Uncharacterized protein n=2 Tax=Rhynchosporium TaxID=38037 RepID=A0A1E1MW88_RHYSE|nr:uncharacterized protein RAG0_02748 [Rhynchosporium agropyri]CZT53343.1 uncharacterized protein RSE6_14838 [Rhynchosporium secalis]